MSARTIRRPCDTWDWLSVEEVERIVFAAFFDACRAQSPPSGQPFVYRGPDAAPEGAPWSDRTDFRDCLLAGFVQRVNALGIDRGAAMGPSREFPGLPVDYQWPAAMAHGCAAVAPAVGPALVSVEGRAPDLHGDRLFSCPEGQDLPAAGAAGDTQAAQEAATA